MKQLKTALVLQGGAARGNFTSGVLDVLMEHGVTFSLVIGVSAGCLNGINFLSNQPRRSERLNTIYLSDANFMSIRNFFLKGDLYDFDWLFGKCATEVLPFDDKAFKANPTRFIVVASALKTGKAAYFEKSQLDDKTFFKACAASSSVPLVARPKKVVGKGRYLDGGATDPIPFAKAIEENFDRIVVVTTQDRHYRKHGKMQRLQAIAVFFRYLIYPRYRRALKNYHTLYNQQTEQLFALEKENRLMVIAPDTPITIKNSEKDWQKRKQVYEKGRAVGLANIAAIKEYLGI